MWLSQMNIIKPNLQIVHVYDESKFFYPRVMLVKCIANFVPNISDSMVVQSVFVFF